MSSKATPFFNRLDAVLESGMEHTVGKMEIFVQKLYQKKTGLGLLENISIIGLDI